MADEKWSEVRISESSPIQTFFETEHGYFVVIPVVGSEKPAYDLYVNIRGDIKMRRIGRVIDGFTHRGKAISLELDKDAFDEIATIGSKITCSSSGADK